MLTRKNNSLQQKFRLVGEIPISNLLMFSKLAFYNSDSSNYID